MLILVSWTALSAQPGNQIPDTTRTYGLSELRMIALTSIRLEACDSLLKLSDKKLSMKDSLLDLSFREKNKIQEQLTSTRQIVSLKNEKIAELESSVRKKDDKINRLRWGCRILGGLFTVSAGFLALFTI